ncbi:hypothetical protein FRB96_003629 [Tulasnella sp. 330]|nr:hypothetical protein FRB96_003629 [Tulasnella sp. 330]KAG8876420.1 hypothetical protein FRB97_004194 [Tulasnella sp. 331]KAG8881813.1 hypothetical protein FRB98_004125 [Tulasnella sp. 332]
MATCKFTDQLTSSLAAVSPGGEGLSVSHDHGGFFHAHDHPGGGLGHSHDGPENGNGSGAWTPLDHGHTHEHLEHAGEYQLKGVVTNDIFTREDQEFLIKNGALPAERIVAIETGGCPHAAIREDISANMGALEGLQAKFGCELLLVESGGDNLAANYSRELADYIIYVIDVSGGDKIPRKGGPGISQSDLLVINKIDLAQYVGASLDVMARDSAKMRDNGPTVFASVKHGKGVDQIKDLILGARRASGAANDKGKTTA